MRKSRLLLFVIYSLFFFLFLTLSFSCKRESMRTTASPIPEQEKGSDFSYVPEPHERMRLGQSFGNPYSLASIQRAYDTLLALQGETEFPRLNPTHLYIRFLPRDTGEYNALRRVGLELFSYPLDRIPSTGLAPYHDPTLPPSAITWQYTTIQVGQSIPDVLHEVLEECFLPPGANGSDPNVPGQIEETIWRYVELISLFQHGLVNELDLEDFDEVEDAPVSLRLLGKNNTRFNPFGWFWKKIKKILPTIRFPQGTIRVYDTQDAGYVPAQRLRVRCHLGVYWSSTRTDRNGHYVMSTGFLVSPYYSLHFDYAEGVSLWGNWAFFAEATYYAGFHSRAGYSRDVGREAGIWDWITVGNAVVYYYDYCDQFGIMPPPGGLKIAVFTKWRVAATCMLHHVRQPMAFMTNKHWINFFFCTIFLPTHARIKQSPLCGTS